jgi:hypothetical protein
MQDWMQREAQEAVFFLGPGKKISHSDGDLIDE